MKAKLTKILPDTLRQKLQKAFYLLSDRIENFMNPNSMLPPRAMMMVKTDNFIAVGQDFKGHFIEMAGLQPNHRVLDVGCGVGRMAIPLTTYLSEDGEYWGLDTRKKGIEWCQNHITKKYNNFRFIHSDVYNNRYNTKSKAFARDYQFPFDDDSFDFVFLISVFTHMISPDVKNYIREISRVLKPGGTCFITYFLVGLEANYIIPTEQRQLSFQFQGEGYLTTDEKRPENSVAYREDFVKDLYLASGLNNIQIIRHGTWSQKKDFLGMQDLVIARKR